MSDPIKSSAVGLPSLKAAIKIFLQNVKDHAAILREDIYDHRAEYPAELYKRLFQLCCMIEGDAVPIDEFDTITMRELIREAERTLALLEGRNPEEHRIYDNDPEC